MTKTLVLTLAVINAHKNKRIKSHSGSICSSSMLRVISFLGFLKLGYSCTAHTLPGTSFNYKYAARENFPGRS